MKKDVSLIKVQNICLDAILKRMDVNLFIERIFSELHLPIIVFDETITLITYAFPSDFHFQDWDEIVEHGTAPQRKLISNHFNYQEIIYHNRKPTFINWGTTKDRPQTCCPIIHNGLLYGYIGISFEDCPYQDEVMQAEEIVAKTLGFLLSSTLAKQDYSSLNAEQLISELLLNDSPSSDTIAAFESQMKAPYCFSILHLHKSQQALMHHIRRNLIRGFSGVIATVYENGDLYMIAEWNKKGEFAEWLEQFMFSLEENSYYCCTSDPFSDIQKLSIFRKQAQQTLETCMAQHEKSRICSFSEMYLDILGHLYLRRFGNTASIPSAIRSLSEYDRKHEKHYLKTLSVYLEHMMSFQKTATALNIHPNTVRIRINKINEILEFDPNTIETVEPLGIALRLMYDLEREETHE